MQSVPNASGWKFDMMYFFGNSPQDLSPASFMHQEVMYIMLVHHSKTLQSCQKSGQWPPQIEFCTFDRMQNVAGMWDRHSCMPFSAAKFLWKFWKSHKELTLCRQESKAASSSPQMPVGLVWKPLSQLGAEKNPILNPDLKRNYKLLATLHWLKLFWCGHFSPNRFTCGVLS